MPLSSILRSDLRRPACFANLCLSAPLSSAPGAQIALARRAGSCDFYSSLAAPSRCRPARSPLRVQSLSARDLLRPQALENTRSAVSSIATHPRPLALAPAAPAAPAAARPAVVCLQTIKSPGNQPFSSETLGISPFFADFTILPATSRIQPLFARVLLRRAPNLWDHVVPQVAHPGPRSNPCRKAAREHQLSESSSQKQKQYRRIRNLFFRFAMSNHGGVDFTFVESGRQGELMKSAESFRRIVRMPSDA